MSKHGWRNPWRQFVAGSCCPVCRKQFHTRARAVDHLAHRAERCRQAIQQDPGLFQKKNCHTRKIGPTRLTRAKKGSETEEVLVNGLSSGSLNRAEQPITVTLVLTVTTHQLYLSVVARVALAIKLLCLFCFSHILCNSVSGFASLDPLVAGPVSSSWLWWMNGVTV